MNMNIVASFHHYHHRHRHQHHHVATTAALLFVMVGVFFVNPHVTPIMARSSKSSTITTTNNNVADVNIDTVVTTTTRTVHVVPVTVHVTTTVLDTAGDIISTKKDAPATVQVETAATVDVVTTVVDTAGNILTTLNDAPAPNPATDADTDTYADTNKKVQVELYYESQCPGCRQMITTSFDEAYHKEGFLDMAEITFIPYGNALETKNENDDDDDNTDTDDTYTFECQHGESECVYNLIETCALHKIGSVFPLQQFHFLHCIEQHDDNRDPEQDYESVALACATSLGIDISIMDAIHSCVISKEGNRYEHDMAVKTESLQPPHTYVPYVVANGVHTEQIQTAVTQSLFDYVCHTYQGSQRSTQCPYTSIDSDYDFAFEFDLEPPESNNNNNDNKEIAGSTAPVPTTTTNEENVCYRDGRHMYDFGKTKHGAVATTVTNSRRRLLRVA